MELGDSERGVEQGYSERWVELGDSERGVEQGYSER